MDKVGVVTWVDGSNYGGFLQAYATNIRLKEKGKEPVFLQFKTKKSMLKHFLGALLLAFVRPDIIMSRIRKHRLLKKTLEVKTFFSYSDLKSYSKSLAFCICGSDQIWNIDGLEKDRFVLLDFIEPRKRFALSPSISHTSLNPTAIQFLKQYLPLFQKISIREKNGYDIIKRNTGIEAELLFDPVFMFDACEWKKMTSGSIRLPTNPYVLVYLLNDNDYYYNLIAEYAKNKKIDVIQVNLKRDVHPKFKIKYCDPFGFVQLIENAAYIFTDSFHGLSFSLIFNKSFTIFKRFNDDIKSENSRIYHILDFFEIRERLISNDSIVDDTLFENINDYADINKKMSIERKKIIDYLDDICERSGQL